MAEDKISELPIHIIHDILCRICNYGLEEEARTSVLSKTWNSIWRQRPDVIISQSFHNKSPEKFVQFVDDTLRPHVEQNLRIKTLCLMDLHPPELAPHMDRWIDLATQHNVTFLQIDISWSDSLYYNIPDAIYAAKTLTKLWLYQCNFEIDNNNSTTNKLQRLITTCPLIRDLRLRGCTGIQNNLHLSGLVNLETLELRRCDKVEKVEIWAPNLRKFVYVGTPLHKRPKKREPESLPCTIDILDGYNTLEYLHLEDTTMTDQQFEYQLSKFTALETLQLTGCYVMKNIKVVSEKLKRFYLWDWGNVEQVNMMLAPNLKTFDFDGFKMPFSISTMDPYNLEGANLHFFLMPQVRKSYIFGDVDTSWCNNIQDFVQKFNYSKGLIFVIICEENNSILIYEDPRDILVPPTRELRLCIENPSMRLESFVYNLISDFNPRIVSIVPSTESRILQVFHETTKESSVKQYKRLNEVTIHKGAAENYEDEDNGETSHMYSWLRSTSLIERITTFTFKWKKYCHS